VELRIWPQGRILRVFRGYNLKDLGMAATRRESAHLRTRAGYPRARLSSVAGTPQLCRNGPSLNRQLAECAKTARELPVSVRAKG